MRWAPVAVVVVLAMTACSDGQEESADPTVPTAPRPSSSTTAATIDVTVVPERIDEAYLNAVLVALDKIDGDATRIIQKAKRLTPRRSTSSTPSTATRSCKLRRTTGWPASARIPR